MKISEINFNDKHNLGLIKDQVVEIKIGLLAKLVHFFTSNINSRLLLASFMNELKHDASAPAKKQEVCQACKTRVKNWNGDDPKCSFLGEAFSSEGWNCATAELIRDLVDCEMDDGIHYHRAGDMGDQQYATVDVLDIDELKNDERPYPVSLYVGWYKTRGRTEAMWLIFETAPPRPPTEAECLAIVTYYKKLIADKKNEDLRY